MDPNKLARFAYLLLRVGAAIAFLYPPINALQDPNSWIGYFPPFLLGYVPDEVLLHAFGVVEVVVGLWILSGWKVFWPAALATIMLIAIVVFNLPQFQVVFRDLSIACATLALALMNWPTKRAILPS
jgi:uncharacterized membrane protein YphA (DoxX/SURF4 family)